MAKYQLSKIKLICNMSNLNDLQASLNKRECLRDQRRYHRNHVIAAVQLTQLLKELEGITT